MRRLLVLRSEDTISGVAVEAEFNSSSSEALQEIETESLADSVQQHIRRYFEALDGGLPAPGLHARVLREVEHPLIVATLEITRGNQVRAAKILGMNRNTLRAKINALGIAEE